MFLYPFARQSHWDQQSDYQANILNQYQQRTISPVAELLGQSDPRANLTARATDSEGNQLHVTGRIEIVKSDVIEVV